MPALLFRRATGTLARRRRDPSSRGHDEPEQLRLFNIRGAIITLGHNDQYMRELSVASAKQHFSEVLARVAFTGETYLIKRRGKAMAAIVNPSQILDHGEPPPPNPWLELLSLGRKFPKFSSSLKKIHGMRRHSKAG